MCSRTCLACVRWPTHALMDGRHCMLQMVHLLMPGFSIPPGACVRVIHRYIYMARPVELQVILISATKIGEKMFLYAPGPATLQSPVSE